MKGAGSGDRFVALLLLGALLFSPPLLEIFRVPELVFGVPALFLYLFAAWGLLIAVLVLVSRRAEDGEAPGEPPG